MTNIDLDIILTWDYWHWTAYLLSFSYICRTSNLDSVCDLGFDFSAHCSWTPKQTRARVVWDFGLTCSHHLIFSSSKSSSKHFLDLFIISKYNNIIR